MGSMDSGDGLRIDVLGPVEAWVNGRQVALGGQRPRALLAVLALMRGRVVSSERLIDELWGEDPPARARDSLQMHVSRLRKALAEAGELFESLRRNLMWGRRFDQKSGRYQRADIGDGQLVPARAPRV